MKISKICLFMAALTLMSCSKDEKDIVAPSGGATTISIKPETGVDVQNLPSDASEFTLTVLSDGDWNISSNSSWLTHSPSGGVKNKETAVKVKVAQNKEFEGRDGILTVKSGSKTETITVHQRSTDQIMLSTNSLTCGASESSITLTVNANSAWTATSDQSWCTLTPASGQNGETKVTVKTTENTSNAERKATLTFTAGDTSVTAAVTQYSDYIEVPDGYSLVWNDEFNGSNLSSDWTYEVQGSGWVNNELQNYIRDSKDGKKTVELKDGMLNINCFKASDGKVYSGRIKAKESTGWKFGIMEARIKLPKGKGTWPAFWMMPCKVDWANEGWPKCGEIDIMEEVGANANYTSSSIHCASYNHTIGTQKTAERYTAGAEDDFHVYRLEWTENYIKTYVDGKPLLTFNNDGKGDVNTWPFSKEFYIILNLAWGGDWGGYKGIDESALPTTMQVDYVRVFQKN